MGSAAYLILEDGTLLKGESVGSRREVISEIVFNTSMTGYLEVNSPVFLLTSVRKTPSRIFSQDMIFPEFRALIPER